MQLVTGSLRDARTFTVSASWAPLSLVIPHESADAIEGPGRHVAAVAQVRDEFYVVDGLPTEGCRRKSVRQQESLDLEQQLGMCTHDQTA